MKQEVEDMRKALEKAYESIYNITGVLKFKEPEDK